MSAKGRPEREYRSAKREGTSVRPAAVRTRQATHFYVYYRVVADTSDGRARIAALMADLEARTGVRGALLARSDDPSTWMETYGPVTGAASFARLLATLARKHDAMALVADGKRHVERFAALAPLRRRRAA